MCRKDLAIVEGNPSVLIWVFPVLGRDGAFLLLHWFPGVQGAILEYDGGVSKHKVDSSVDVAFAIELTLRVDVKSVLVADYVTVEDDRMICSNTESHRLVLLRTGEVLE